MASYPTQPGMTFPVNLADVHLKVDERGRHVSHDSFEYRVASGQIPEFRVITLAGENISVGSTFEFITEGGIFRMPQLGDETTLRIAAGGSADDAAAGIGAQEIVLTGLDETGATVSELVTTNGILASLPTTTTFLRLLRIIVTKSGTYPVDLTSASHVDTITIENGAGTEVWGEISLNGFAQSNDKIGCGTVALGDTAQISRLDITVNSTRLVDIALFIRNNILQTDPPFSPFIIGQELTGIEGSISVVFEYPAGPFLPLTDIGIMARLTAGLGGPDAVVSSVLTLITRRDPT